MELITLVFGFIFLFGLPIVIIGTAKAEIARQTENLRQVGLKYRTNFDLTIQISLGRIWIALSIIYLIARFSGIFH